MGKQVSAPSPSPLPHFRAASSCPRLGEFLADARRSGAPALRSTVVASVGNSLEDGWTTVVHRRDRATAHRLAPRATRPSRPVPPELEGRCFNYLPWDHVAAACQAASRCFRCKEEGHQAKDCWRHRRRRGRLLASSSHAAAPPALHPRRLSSSSPPPAPMEVSDGTVSARSVSTGYYTGARTSAYCRRHRCSRRRWCRPRRWKRSLARLLGPGPDP
ncbi:hypothetical protein BS78_09G169600 [Paspalum vaginatum]|nr:hypothetical protein BS78_09G169600 [Paspalum vaginatum]